MRKLFRRLTGDRAADRGGCRRPRAILPATAAFGLGLLGTLGFAPYDLWPVSTAALILLLLLVSLRPRPGVTFLNVMSFGTALNLSTLAWLNFVMEDFGSLPPAASWGIVLIFALYLALPYALLAAIAARLSGGRPAVLLLGFLPAAFALADAFVGWFLTGFPWLYLGYTCLDSPLGSFFPWCGVRGVTALLWLFAGAVALGARRRFLFLPPAAVLFAGGVLLTDVSFTTPQAPLPASLVQGNVAQRLKWRPEEYRRIFKTYLDLSLTELRAGRLVIWPEAALPATPDQDPAGFAVLRQAVPPTSLLVLGMPRREDGRLYNSLLVLDGRRQAVVCYDKRALVPFGETVPLRPWLGALQTRLTLPSAEFAAGQAAPAPLDLGGVPFTPAICYEAVFADLLNAPAYRASQAIVMISNDAWFGPTRGPQQHLNIARARAKEAQKPMLRVTGNGVTAVIDRFGRVTAQLPPDAAAVLRTELTPCAGSTPYAVLGNLPAWLLLAAQLGAGAWARRRDPAANRLQKLIRP